MKKEKKKTLTISTNLTKKIDTSSISSNNKKSFSVEKKKPFRSNKFNNKVGLNQNSTFNPESKKKELCEKVCRTANY